MFRAQRCPEPSRFTRLHTCALESGPSELIASNEKAQTFGIFWSWHGFTLVHVRHACFFYFPETTEASNPILGIHEMPLTQHGTVLCRSHDDGPSDRRK